jgi:CDP-2,3-bis-(O-geranylgeranyl)-sn-glycerol synthase
MELANLIVRAIIFIFPAYCANATPVLGGGGPPLDFGKKFIDGKRVFGKNKTIRGFLIGLACGIGVGLLESAVFEFPYVFGLVVSSGALLGDLAGAFLKRRLDIAPGNLLPLVDQVDFVVGALVFSFLFCGSLLTWELALIVLLITPPIHLLTNFGAYKAGLKSNPW